MSFIITEYYYPLKEPVHFYGDVYFDNPRNVKEVEIIAKIIKMGNYSEKYRFPEEEYQVGSEIMTFRSIFDGFFERNKSKECFKSFYDKHGKEKNIYKVFAKMWVLIRFDQDKETKETIEKDASEYLKSLQLLPYVSNSKYSEVCSILSFLDFMCSNENKIPSDIIWNLQEHGLGFGNLLPKIIVQSIQKETDKREEYPYGVFSKTIKAYNEWIPYIEKNKDNEKFRYICDSLKNMSALYFENPKMYTVAIVSLLELLLTHSPDANRFNVEESISKQFKNKLLYILVTNGYKCDISELEKELNIIYSVRSCIAHGNYDTLSKNLTKAKNSIYSDKEFVFDDIDPLDNLNAHLINYLRIVLKEYILNEEKLGLLKNI